MMSDKFPPDLLKQPVAKRLKYFQDCKVGHPKLKEVYEFLMRAIREPAGASLIFVYGPSGVGKTTLRERVEKELIQNSLLALETARGRIPVVGIEAMAPESRNFNWKDYNTRALVALEEPLIDYKIDYGVQGIHRSSEGNLVISSKVVAPALRRALEQALRHRQPEIFFIDEAQHLAKIASGHKLQDQLDCLKSLANTTGILHGLLGTYELLTFRNMSAQLSRRSVDIHFQRYRADVKEDIQAFQSVIFSFERQMPLEEQPDLVPHWEYFYERSLGCIGILKNWLTGALRDALEDGTNTLTIKHLERRSSSIAQCQKMFKEIQEGEKQLAETEADLTKLRAALGLDVELTKSNFSQPEISAQLSETTVKSPQRQSSVGKRKAKRDHVGVEKHAN